MRLGFSGLFVTHSDQVLGIDKSGSVILVFVSRRVYEFLLTAKDRASCSIASNENCLVQILVPASSTDFIWSLLASNENCFD
mmetsp:Transcript_19423/g.40694  ORF Transcript_19423/g.40694 Transcript_19423/m.40694 type:complete len:82 (-) Transcript_19423:12-257(-)